MRPIIRTGRVAIALLILALAAGAFPETAAPGAAARKLATLGDIAAEGNASSLDYAKARNAAAAAAAAVPALVKAKSSTLAATYSYSSVKTGASDAGNSFGAALSIPLLDQVGLSASVSSDLSSIVSASLNPLAHSDARAQALIAYEKALAAEENAGRAAGRTAVKAALAWMGQIRQLATQEKVTALKQEAYEAAKASNAVDGAMTTLDDLVPPSRIGPIRGATSQRRRRPSERRRRRFTLPSAPRAPRPR